MGVKVRGVYGRVKGEHVPTIADAKHGICTRRRGLPQHEPEILIPQEDIPVFDGVQHRLPQADRLRVVRRVDRHLVRVSCQRKAAHLLRVDLVNGGKKRRRPGKKACGHVAGAAFGTKGRRQDGQGVVAGVLPVNGKYACDILA